MKINFCGATQDIAGYGEFARYFIYALDKAGVEVSVEPILVDPKNVDYGHKGALVKKLTRKVKADLNIINMIPPLFRRHKQIGIPNVGFTMWEADKLPQSWVPLCNEMDAIFVPCQWNRDVFESSGVNVPIFVINPGVEPDHIPAFDINSIASSTTKFYSIFQWTERKNPQGLIKAYFSEFSNKDDVLLTLKTYKHARLPNNEQSINEEISAIKKSLNIAEELLPKISLVTNSLSAQQMSDLHNTNDCFVLPHRAEGFGMPHFEAMLYGKPVISTNFSGNTDFMKNDNCFLIESSLTPVCNMSWYVPWYNGRMHWAEPNLEQLSAHMRFVHNNRRLSKERGLKGREYLLSNFTMTNSSSQIVAAAKDILNRKV